MYTHKQCIFILYHHIVATTYTKERERAMHSWTACLHLAGMCCTRSWENWERSCGFQIFQLSFFFLVKFSVQDLQSSRWASMEVARVARVARPTSLLTRFTCYSMFGIVSVSLHFTAEHAESIFLFQSATQSMPCRLHRGLLQNVA